MPRFVLLEHDYPKLHRDLMLEADGLLRTWRLPATLDLALGFVGERIGDHRLLYLDYEGPVSDSRGSVVRIDAGEMIWLERAESRIRMDLGGSLLNGRWEGSLQPDGSWRFLRLSE